MTSKENPSGWTAAPGQGETDVSFNRNITNLTDDCQSVSAQVAESGGQMAMIDQIFDDIVSIYGGQIQSDGSCNIHCPCPDHEDKNPSCNVKNTGDKILVHCFAGCPQDAVISALRSKNLWHQKTNSTDTNGTRPPGIMSVWTPKGSLIGMPISDCWEYKDQTGQVIGCTARYDGQDRDKYIIPYFKKSGDQWRTGGPKEKPIYGAELLNDNDKPVLIVEGEKSTDAARSLVGNDYACVTWMGGTGSVAKVDWSPLNGRDVYIWPDKDKPGVKAAQKIQTKILNARIIAPPVDAPEKWDLADALADGWTSEQVLEHIKTAAQDPGTDAIQKNQWDEPMDMGTAIHQTPDPMAWLMSNRVPKGRGIILTGLGGSSKTRCLYSIACGSVIGSLPWSWVVETIGKAVLVLTEDTAQDVHRTVHFMAMDLDDKQKKTLVKNLIIYPLAGKDTRLMVKSSKGTVKESPLFQSLKKKITALGDVVFIGLDPALSVSEGDELDQGHQRALGKMADDLAVQTGATVCLVAHATKGSLIKQELTSHNSRGGGAITDAVRAEYSMRNMTIEEANHAGITDVEERKRHVQLVATKGNTIPPSAFVPVWLRRDDFGNLVEVDIEMDGKGTLTDQDMEILKVHSEIAVGCPLKLADWRTECINRGLITGCTDNAQRQAMKRVVNKLEKAGLIKKGGGRGLWEQTQ